MITLKELVQIKMENGKLLNNKKYKSNFINNGKLIINYLRGDDKDDK